MKWFRMYSEARNDAKLRVLTDSQHRVWFNLLCLAGEQFQRGTISGYDDELLAVEVANGDVGLLQDTLVKLEKLRMIVRNETGIIFSSWEKRQYDNPSDRPKSVSERVRKHRDKTKSNERQLEKPKPVTNSNDDVTGCNEFETTSNTLYTDTDTESETDSEEKELLPPISSVAQKHEPVVVMVGDRNLHVFNSVIDQYKHYFNFDPNPTIMQLLHSYLDDGVQLDMLAWVMRYAAEKGKAWDYAKGTLEKMFVQGVRTAEQAEKAHQEYMQQQQSQKVVPIRDSKLRVDKLPESVQWQMQQEKEGTKISQEAKGINDFPEMVERLQRMRSRA
ncbi:MULTISPECIES: DnaD domain protein [Bacillales]|uniref:DnaD domain protein n=1 Tax=Bacillales TaxID=1385 RepID=UPI00034C6E33|nr:MULTISPECIES: DnaD domain protein [Bacillales]KMZ42542.1 hypothetical protein AC624_16210 [Bacillus sp. FJAT-27238]